MGDTGDHGWQGGRRRLLRSGLAAGGQLLLGGCALDGLGPTLAGSKPAPWLRVVRGPMSRSTAPTAAEPSRLLNRP